MASLQVDPNCLSSIHSRRFELIVRSLEEDKVHLDENKITHLLRLNKQLSQPFSERIERLGKRNEIPISKDNIEQHKKEQIILKIERPNESDTNNSSDGVAQDMRVLLQDQKVSIVYCCMSSGVIFI